MSQHRSAGKKSRYSSILPSRLSSSHHPKAKNRPTRAEKPPKKATAGTQQSREGDIKCKMQNAECKMGRSGLLRRDAPRFIPHFAFCIPHLQKNRRQRMQHPLPAYYYCTLAHSRRVRYFSTMYWKVNDLIAPPQPCEGSVLRRRMYSLSPTSAYASARMVTTPSLVPDARVLENLL